MNQGFPWRCCRLIFVNSVGFLRRPRRRFALRFLSLRQLYSLIILIKILLELINKAILSPGSFAKAVAQLQRGLEITKQIFPQDNIVRSLLLPIYSTCCLLIINI